MEIGSPSSLSGLARLNSLKELRLNGNALRTLTDKIMGLESLEVLNLSGNQLEELPEEIGELSKLRILNLPEINSAPFLKTSACARL